MDRLEAVISKYNRDIYEWLLAYTATTKKTKTQVIFEALRIMKEIEDKKEAIMKQK